MTGERIRANLRRARTARNLTATRVSPRAWAASAIDNPSRSTRVNTARSDAESRFRACRTARTSTAEVGETPGVESAQCSGTYLTLDPNPENEYIERGFGPATRAGRLAGTRTPVKNALLDQRRIAGIGNIYASEALHRAGVDPRRPAGSLDSDEIRRLQRRIRAVLGEALARAGTTLRDYQALNGRSGSFQSRLRVYGREGEPCRRCGTAVRRIVQAGRSTYFCPECQR